MQSRISVLKYRRGLMVLRDFVIVCRSRFRVENSLHAGRAALCFLVPGRKNIFERRVFSWSADFVSHSQIIWTRQPSDFNFKFAWVSRSTLRASFARQNSFR